MTCFPDSKIGCWLYKLLVFVDSKNDRCLLTLKNGCCLLTLRLAVVLWLQKLPSASQDESSATSQRLDGESFLEHSTLFLSLQACCTFHSQCHYNDLPRFCIVLGLWVDIVWLWVWSFQAGGIDRQNMMILATHTQNHDYNGVTCNQNLRKVHLLCVFLSRSRHDILCGRSELWMALGWSVLALCF